MMMHATGAVYVVPGCWEERLGERKGRERKDGEKEDAEEADRRLGIRPYIAFVMFHEWSRNVLYMSVSEWHEFCKNRKKA